MSPASAASTVTASPGAVDRPNDPKVDCPGPLFDFFRLAREVWDWWWYPFDADAGSTHVARRGYRRWKGDTPLLEYYWDEAEATRSERRTEGIHGTGSSPATFRLEPASPVYALANGDLIAARFPTPGTGVSGAFALVRHEVFHLQRAAGPGPTAPGPGEIDFDRAPSYVYSLYYHLGRPEGMTFDAVHDDNPDWLNRVLIRKKECDLGVAFYGRSNHGGIPQASWDSRPPGEPERPTTLEGWQEDQQALGTFLTALREGRTAVVQRGPRIQPIRIILGDLLGESGVIRRQGGTDTHGVRVEVFSPSFSPPGFQQTDTADWSPPRDATSPSLRYVSEWARAIGVDELQAIGVDPEHTAWWWSVAPALQGDTLLPAEAKLPLSGAMFHFDPLDFMRWINEVTWRHEWPKYRGDRCRGERGAGRGRRRQPAPATEPQALTGSGGARQSIARARVQLRSGEEVMPHDLGSAIRDEVLELLAPLAGVAAVPVGTAPTGTAMLLQTVGHVGALAADAGLESEVRRLAGLTESVAALGDREIDSWDGAVRVLALARDVMDAVRSVEATLTDPSLAERARELGADLAEQLFALYLRSQHPALFRTAAALTLVVPAEHTQPEPTVVEDGTVTRLSRPRDHFHFDRLSCSPRQHARHAGSGVSARGNGAGGRRPPRGGQALPAAEGAGAEPGTRLAAPTPCARRRSRSPSASLPPEDSEVEPIDPPFPVRGRHVRGRSGRGGSKAGRLERLPPRIPSTVRALSPWRERGRPGELAGSDSSSPPPPPSTLTAYAASSSRPPAKSDGRRRAGSGACSSPRAERFPLSFSAPVA